MGSGSFLLTATETLLAGFPQGHRPSFVPVRLRNGLPPAAAQSSPFPSTSSSSEETGKRHVEEQKTDHGNPKGWTSEQLDIMAALLQRRPRPSLANRRPPPAPRLPSKHRPVGLPRRRHKPPMATPMVLHHAKDKRYLTHLALQISRLPDGHQASSLLHGCEQVLLRGSLSATIRELGRLGKPLRALETFLWQRHYAHLWPDEKTLFSTIEVLAEARMEEQARDLLQAWAPTSLMAFEALARGLVSARLLHRTLLLKEEAENCGFTLDQGLYAEIILLASRLNKDQEVRMLLQELGTFPELRLSLEHCTSVMAACRKAKIYEAVRSLFEWWKQAGFLPNAIMYEIVITSLASAGKHRDALAIYWEMEKSGCAPDLLAYTALFEICAGLGDSSKALRLFARMKEAQITVTRNIYMNLIKVCCRDGRLGKAREFLEFMKREGMPAVTLEDYVNV